jgi:hypothetical protein
MPAFHIYGDDRGETHLVAWEFPVSDTPVGAVRSIGEVPVEVAGMAAFVDRKPDSGIHEAPRRQFVVVLGGVLEIETSLGERRHLHPGDVMLADDVGTKGHFSRDVGKQPLTLMTVGIAPGWAGPDRHAAREA